MIDFDGILKDLRQERELIEEAITFLERIRVRRGRGPGRPSCEALAAEEQLRNEGVLAEILPRKRGRPLGSKNKIQRRVVAEELEQEGAE